MRIGPVTAAAVVVAALGLAAAPSSAAPGGLRPAVTIGVDGNEPLVRAGPDGSPYVSALPHLYDSRDDGMLWRQSAGAPSSTTPTPTRACSTHAASRHPLSMTCD